MQWPDPYHAYLATPLLSKDVATLVIIYYLMVAGVSSVFVGPFTPFPISLIDRIFAVLTGSTNKPVRPEPVLGKDHKGRKHV
jgi:hypothetical protein